jgi:hypothetical protein
MLCFVVAGENSADVPSSDFRLEGTNYFATSFLTQNGIVTLLIFLKYNLTLSISFAEQEARAI